MDWTEIVFNSFGGLGLFLMGMKIMSEGMQKAAGDGLRKTLNFLTSNRFMAIFVGFFITAVIQSSSATTVMVVGFVNATLMKLTQAIGVMLGANIGTTVTGWIITLKIVKYALPIIGLGVMFRFFAKSERWRYVGEILFGFGLLFLGMQIMKAGFAPLRESPDFIALFTKVNGTDAFSILLGVVIGTITTLIVQSSSAVMGITIALASQGLLSYVGAVSLIMGSNIGTTITAILASIGGNYHAKRAALAHTLFNVLGVVVVLIFFIPFIEMVDGLVPGMADHSLPDSTKPLIGQHIAMAHSMFNIANVIIFTALIPFLAKICVKIIPEPKLTREARPGDFAHIDSSIINTPALGIAESQKKLVVMAKKVAGSALVVQDIIGSLSPQPNLCDDVLKEEKVIDEYQKHITEFLVTLSSGSLSESDANHIGNFMTLSHNLEKFADHLEHITLIYDRIARQELELTEDARETIQEIFQENSNFFTASFNALNEDVDHLSFMDKAQVINRRVKKLIKAAKLEHFVHLRSKKCKNQLAIHYMDLLNYLDGMRSQAYNIAEVATGTKYQHN